MAKTILRYIGNASLIEIPARDLTDDDLKNIAWTGWNADQLVASKLYELVEKPLINQEEIHIGDDVIRSKHIETKQEKKRGK
jgi:hypothetical protein